MIVYSKTKAKFQEDVLTNDIDNIVENAYRKTTGRSVAKREKNAWKNSMHYMGTVLSDAEIPSDAGVAIEYHIPPTNSRIDFILTGKDVQKRETAILIELKQWQRAMLTEMDGVVITRFEHGEHPAAHPSYQAWTYKHLLEDYNQTVQEDKILLYPCAYLHNYEQDGVISHKFYSKYTQEAPVFLKHDALKLRDFIKAHVKYGDKNQIMYRIDHGKIKPSKKLADSLLSMLKGNEEFVMIDGQKVVYETAISLAEKSSPKKKNVLIVEGGPGTGKSVVAINLLVELTKRELVAQYVTRNSAPRLVYEAMLTGTFTRTHISNMFRGSGVYHSSEANSFDCLIVDEAHRLNEKSGMFSHKGENQIKEIIIASKASIFFIDEDQKVTLKDIGDKEEIRHWAVKQKANIVEIKLESQFRCNGSDGYIAWLDNTLQIRETVNTELNTNDYDFRIVDSPTELHNLIREKNEKNNKARMVAGYCWNWVSKKKPELKDIVINGYKATWNLDTDGQAWIIKPNSVSEVGCIHTCQGLELDYVGVIVGPDLIVRNGKVITQPERRATTDRSIQGWRTLFKAYPKVAKERLDAIIKNTYRTLMTRGQKGCYVYFVDKETEEFVKSRIESLDLRSDSRPTVDPLSVNEQVAHLSLPFRILPIHEVVPFKNCVPVYDLKVAAGRFSDEQQVNEVAQGAELQRPEDFEWAELASVFRPQQGLFIAQVIGESMNRRIPNGSWCLFRLSPVGTRQGKVVLVKHREIHDMDTGGHFTVKIYESKKESFSDGTWKHDKIILRPDTTASGYEPIELTSEAESDLTVIAELVAVLG